jgi:hypothetical protein
MTIDSLIARERMVFARRRARIANGITRANGVVPGAVAGVT